MNIRVVRRKRGWSQRRLAQALDVNVTRISAIERELFVPTVTTLRRLACALECSVVDLLSEQDKHQNASEAPHG